MQYLDEVGQQKEKEKPHKTFGKDFRYKALHVALEWIIFRFFLCFED